MFARRGPSFKAVARSRAGSNRSGRRPLKRYESADFNLLVSTFDEHEAGLFRAHVKSGNCACGEPPSGPTESLQVPFQRSGVPFFGSSPKAWRFRLPNSVSHWLDHLGMMKTLSYELTLAFCEQGPPLVCPPLLNAISQSAATKWK